MTTDLSSDFFELFSFVQDMDTKCSEMSELRLYNQTVQAFKNTLINTSCSANMLFLAQELGLTDYIRTSGKNLVGHEHYTFRDEEFSKACLIAGCEELNEAFTDKIKKFFQWAISKLKEFMKKALAAMQRLLLPTTLLNKKIEPEHIELNKFKMATSKLPSPQYTKHTLTAVEKILSGVNKTFTLVMDVSIEEAETYLTKLKESGLELAENMKKVEHTSWTVSETLQFIYGYNDKVRSLKKDLDETNSNITNTKRAHTNLSRNAALSERDREYYMALCGKLIGLATSTHIQALQSLNFVRKTVMALVEAIRASYNK